MKIRTLLAAVALIALSSPAQAQTRSFEFRGESPGQVVDLSARNCSPGPLGTIGCVTPGDTLAGVRSVFLSQNYFNGHLFLVHGIFPTGQYATMLAAFTEKYGEPKMSTETWQNRAGATFPNDIATWEFSDGTLTLKRLGGRVTNAEFEFESPQFTPPPEAPKVDF